jgi:hypothetical protein
MDLSVSCVFVFSCAFFRDLCFLLFCVGLPLYPCVLLIHMFFGLVLLVRFLFSFFALLVFLVFFMFSLS